MFIKTIIKSNIVGGKKFYHYRLVESYRINKKVRHRTILNLGAVSLLDNPVKRKQLADRIEQLMQGVKPLFSEIVDTELEALALKYHGQIIRQMSIQLAGNEVDTPVEKDFRKVDLNSIKHDEVREIGAEWLCKATLEKLDLKNCLAELGWNNKWIELAHISIISRAVFAGSEYRTAKWLSLNSGLPELYNRAYDSVSHHQLYEVAHRLYQAKEKIEPYLGQRTDELFDQKDTIYLYDLTNTYFEGRKQESKKAKYGRSKEKRTDAKLIVLAVVTNVNGFIKYTQFYEGNMSDGKTLKATITDIEQNSQTTQNKKLIVIDAGIATEKNLKMLRSKNYDYLCVSRRKLREYEALLDKPVVTLEDKRGNPIEMKILKAEHEEDHFVYVWSKQKQLKEYSMEEKMIQRYEEELQKIKKAIHTKGGTKKEQKVWERIGRLKQKYPRVNKYFEIKVQAQKGVATKVEWSRKNLEMEKQRGVYFLRTTLDSKDEKTLWKIYQTLKEIEYTFRVLKTDLNLRPVFHQKDKYVEAHLFLGILAYQVVSCIRYELKQHNIRHDWRNIVRIMGSQKLVATTLKGEDKNYFLLKCSRPAPQALEIYKALGINSIPLKMKKSVVPH